MVSSLTSHPRDRGSIPWEANYSPFFLYFFICVQRINHKVPYDGTVEINYEPNNNLATVN